ncbi:hypothetical protein Micbo1qcDRAFT_164733 [Microdochium bolleyi]|uniref:Uncharacterized protein n=1 Tax=Microdochium bolleyi TaxID=196109 RepID=A0A136IZ51_9PEZI|nr:hypothetical protein Micbo1qcDRAFT_164733 [Microdochium bolleyi]
MAAPGSDGQVFRFTDLPPEIRNAIYKILLCSFPIPDYQDDSDRVELPDTITWLDKRRVSTSILRASRQIHDEARTVLIRTNLFVQVEFHLQIEETFKAHKLMINRRIPLLAADGDWTESTQLDMYKPLVAMTYAITSGTESPGALPSSTLRCLILHRELDNLMLRLANADDVWLPGFSARMKHHVTILTFGGSGRDKADREFLGTRAVQQRLLAPFSKHLRGVQNFAIKTNATNKNKSAAGKLDEAPVASTVSAVQKKATKSTADILAALQDLKAKGTTAFRAGDTRMASENWSRACLDIMRLRQAEDFAAAYVSKPRDSPERKFIRDVAEIMFLLNLNLAQNTLKAMQKSLDAGDRMHAADLSGSALAALERAFGEASASETTGLPVAAAPESNARDGDIRGGWRPAHAQMAKLWYRKAKCHRLCREWNDARQAIGFARRTAPADVTILAEEEAILDGASHIGRR